MKGLIGFSMNKVAAMLIIVVILLGGGLYSATSLKLENFPDISFPLVIITTSYSASPQDVMTEVTKPIEDKIANIGDLDSLSSSSSGNGSSIMVQFKQGADTDKKKQDLESLIQSVNLPSDASRPVVGTIGFASIPAYYLAVSAKEGKSQSELDKIYESELKSGFESIAGIDHIDSIGTRETTLDIELKAGALLAYGLAPSDAVNAIQSALSHGTAGAIKVNGNTQMVRVEGELNSLQSLNQLDLTTPGGQVLPLQDIAEIKAVTKSDFVTRVNDTPGIGLNLYKTSTANAVDFSDETDALIKKYEEKYPDLSFKKIYDSADSVRESISSLLREGLMGVALAALIILLFLRNVRMTVIVLVSIPLSVLITMIALKFFNITLNVMSLGGTFIAVGRIVDDSIVVIENIYARLQKAQERHQSVILLAVKEVAMAISSSTFVTVGVFLPIAFVSGIIGGLFRPFAVSVACALLASLLVALTVIPLMAKLLVLRSFKTKKTQEHKGHSEGKMSEIYVRGLQWSLTNRIKTLLIAGLLFVLSIVIVIPNLSINFLSDGAADRQMSFTLKMPYETSIESSDEQSKQIEPLLRDAKDADGNPVFTFIESLVGYNDSNEVAPYVVKINTEVNAKVDPVAMKEQYQKVILAQLPKGSEVDTGSLSGGGGGFNSTDFSYVLSGDDQQELEDAADIVQKKLAEFPELTDIKNNLGDVKTETQVTVSQAKAREYGLSIASIQNTVRSWLGDTELGDIRFDNVVYTTKVGLSEQDKNSLDQLGKLPLKASNGDTIYLSEIASIEQVKAAVSLSREEQKQIVKITASIKSDNKAVVSRKVSAALAKLDLPQGVSTDVQGVSEDIGESFTQLFVAMAVAIAIVYLIMVLCFGNAGTPFAILFSLPLAVIGGLLGLWISGQALNISSMIGFMMLIGIVVTNAIVLLDRVQKLKETGYTTRAALLEGGRVRLRPILMTAGATIGAMVPLLVESSSTLISAGFAAVVIGGLITSTVLTLVVVPVIFEILESIRLRFSRRTHNDISTNLHV